jgi:NitT/TauT family transport system substrate-binding protein
MRRQMLLAAALGFFAADAAFAQTLKVALPQKGNWDTGIVEYGVKAGIFKDAGLDIEISYTAGGAATVQAVISGSVDVAMQTGLLGLIGAYAKGAPVRVISASMTGSPDIFWYARADKGIKSLKDATDKTMSYSAAGSSSHLLVLSLLEANKIKAKPTATGGIPSTYTQVMSGQIDIGWAVPPFAIADVKAGKVNIVAKGNDLPEIRDTTVRVNFANENSLKTKRDLFVKFSQAYVKSLEWAYANDKALDYFAEAAEVPKDVAKESREQFYPQAALQPFEIRGLDTSLKQALEFKFIPKAMTEKDVAGLFDILVPKK